MLSEQALELIDIVARSVASPLRDHLLQARSLLTQMDNVKFKYGIQVKEESNRNAA